MALIDARGGADVGEIQDPTRRSDEVTTRYGHYHSRMRIACIGGGPAGLYGAILAKKAFPAAHVEVFERNQPTDTFGWGVVFSDETLGGFERADPESMAAIRRHFAYWSDIETYLESAPGKLELVRSTGHGFCGLARKSLLEILQARARGRLVVGDVDPQFRAHARPALYGMSISTQ